MITEYKQDIYSLKDKFDEYIRIIDPFSAEKEIGALELQVSDDNFWQDNDNANAVLKKLNTMKKKLDPWHSFKNRIEDLIVLYQLAEDAGASEYEEEIKVELVALKTEMDRLELLELMSEENDIRDAILEIHPGAGGTEACDWAQMLYRMYTRWAERHSYTIDLLDILDGEEAGLKSVTILIKGEYAYGSLKFESGIHRLVRISPFDSNARRHTSFASVLVSPDLDDNLEFEIKQEELRIDTYRAGGAGGQHVNKTDSAVRITHLPTNINAKCQNERSQLKNKTTAMKILKSRLYDYFKKIQDKEREDDSPEKKEIAWGSQIRSYTFQPYTLVKDHRTKAEISNVQGVMDGDIDFFLDVALKELSLKKR